MLFLGGLSLAFSILMCIHAVRSGQQMYWLFIILAFQPIGGIIYLFVILASVFVCTLAIQGAATRMMFSMSRDRHLPGGAIWGQVNSTFKTPANAAIATGVLAALPILFLSPLGGFYMSIAATGLIYLSYFLCNIGVLAARRKGWPSRGWCTSPNTRSRSPSPARAAWRSAS